MIEKLKSFFECVFMILLITVMTAILSFCALGEVIISLFTGDDKDEY